MTGRNAPEFLGRSVVVTGGARGIGRAAVLAFARAGASVLIADLDEARGHNVVEEVAATGGRARFERIDVSDARDCERMVQAAIDLGPLAAAFNNAGINDSVGPYAADHSIDGWRRALDVNLTGVFLSVRAELPALLQAGGGAIVNTASAAGVVAITAAAGYVAAKHGVIGLTKAVCLEYGGRGIRCNALAPGYIDTPLLAGLATPTSLEPVMRRIPQGRMGASEEVAAAAVWLASAEASYVNGCTLSVDGGFLSR